MPIDKKQLAELDTYFSAREQQLFDCFAHVDNLFDDEIQSIINPADGSTYDPANPMLDQDITQTTVVVTPSPITQPSQSMIDTTGDFVKSVENAIESKRKVTLRRLIMGTANAISDELASDKYPAQGQFDKDLLRERVVSYKADIRPFLPALGLLGFWGGTQPDALAVEAIDRLANAHQKNPLEEGRMPYLVLRRYPVVSALYAIGIGAVAGGNYRGLLRVLRDTVFYEHGQTKQKLWIELGYLNAENRDLWNTVLGRDVYFPVSQVLEDDLREALSEMIPIGQRYVEHFDRFEFFASLEFFLSTERALGASFMWRRRARPPGPDVLTEIRAEAAAAGPSWKPLKAGLLKGTDKSDVFQLLDEFEESVAEVQRSYRIW